jgi:hypothetical protein
MAFQAATQPMSSSLGLKAREAGGSKPWYEVFSGGQWSWRLGRIVQKIRIFNRREDAYHERVVDPETGKVIHECSEPLSEHKGHGSAKPKL